MCGETQRMDDLDLVEGVNWEGGGRLVFSIEYLRLKKSKFSENRKNEVEVKIFFLLKL